MCNTRSLRRPADYTDRTKMERGLMGRNAEVPYPTSSPRGGVIYNLPYFYSRIYKHPSGCWLWRGSIAHGYGRISWSTTKHYYAHRWLYWLTTGEDPEVLHHKETCIGMHCCNPAHLTPTTRVLHGIMHQREDPAWCPKGHPFSPRSRGSGPGCRTCWNARQRAIAQERRHRAAKASPQLGP